MNDLKRKIDEELKDVRLSEDLKTRILDQTKKSKPIPLEKHCEKPRWRWLLTAAVVGIFVMMIPVTIFAVTSLYKISFRKDENQEGYLTVLVAKGTSLSTETLTGFEQPVESATVSWQTIIEVQENPDGSFRYFPKKEAWIEEGERRTRIDVDMSKESFYFLTFSYLPKGVRLYPENPSNYVMATGELAISPLLIILDEEQNWEFPYRQGNAVKTFEVNGHSAFAVYKEKGFCELGMLLEDQNLMINMFIGNEISESEEEIEKILAGVVVELRPYCEEGYTEMPATVYTYDEFVKLWGGEKHE